jgi:hypothetical protein
MVTLGPLDVADVWQFDWVGEATVTHNALPFGRVVQSRFTIPYLVSHSNLRIFLFSSPQQSWIVNPCRTLPSTLSGL